MTLPSAFAIDQRHLGNICSEKELAANQCAGRTPIGKATTTTPLLDQPLTGPVYAVSGSGGLPRLAFILDGQVDLLPRAETKTDHQGRRRSLQTTVPVVPDAPIGHFRSDHLRRQDAATWSTPATSAARCPVTKVDYTGQNGKSYSAVGQGQGRLRQAVEKGAQQAPRPLAPPHPPPEPLQARRREAEPRPSSAEFGPMCAVGRASY